MAPSPTGPNEKLSERYYSRPEDLQRLEKEQEELSKLLKNYINSIERYKKVDDQDDPDPEENDKVATYGNVNLSENECDLLNQGPSFIVTSRLSEEEMRVESSVTLTKKKMGQEEDGCGRDV